MAYLDAIERTNQSNIWGTQRLMKFDMDKVKFNPIHLHKNDTYIHWALDNEEVQKHHNLLGCHRRNNSKQYLGYTKFQMSYSRRSRYSPSPSPVKCYNRSVSRSLSRSRSRSHSRSGSRSRSQSRGAENPGNNLYVTGLSARITERELEKHFAAEGKVMDVHLVVDPWTRESRGFGFVTMETVEEADRCIKYLDRSVLEGRIITVEKARRRRGRTPTPGRYLGLRTVCACRRSSSYSLRRSPSYSPYRRSYSRSPYSDHSGYHSHSPYSRRRSYAPYYNQLRSYSPYDQHRSYYRSWSPYSRSPIRRRERSYSSYDSRYGSPDDRCYGRRHRHRSVSQSVYPRPRRSSRRSYLCSVSPLRRRSSRRRSYLPSVSPSARSSRRSYSCSISPRPRSSERRGGSSKHVLSRGRSYSRSPGVSASSRSVSRSICPRSTSSST